MNLKLRAWDKKNQRWMTPEIEDNEESELRLDIWGNLYFKKPWFEQESGTVTIVDGSEMFDIMQSTGLKDKNGVEIYEHDIVKVGTLDGDPIGYIEWRADMECYQVINYINPFGREIVSEYHTKYFEVIGNIWEDGELLEVAE